MSFRWTPTPGVEARGTKYGGLQYLWPDPGSEITRPSSQDAGKRRVTLPSASP